MKNLCPVLLLPFLVLLACTRDNTTQYETNPLAEQVVDAASVPFTEFASGLPSLSLPFTANCTFDYVTGSRLDTTAASNYLKPYEIPYRRISITPEVTALLVLFPTDETLPRLRTYDLQGRILDEQDLKFSPCGTEPGYAHVEQFTVQKDFSILHIDSTLLWKTDPQYNEVPNTKKLTVTRRKFKISPSGDISEIK